MSIFNRLKSEIRQTRASPHSYYPNPTYAGGQNEVVILPEKPKKKRKLMEVQNESKATLKENKKKNDTSSSSCMSCFELDDEEGKDGLKDNEGPKKVSWGPPEILNHLGQPEVVNNINYVISTLNKTEIEEEDKSSMGGGKKKTQVDIVWDHSQSPAGKKSDNNFFLWFETMSAEETRKIMARENLIYE